MLACAFSGVEFITRHRFMFLADFLTGQAGSPYAFCKDIRQILEMTPSIRLSGQFRSSELNEREPPSH